MAVVVGSYFYMGRVAKFEHSKERRPAWISRNHHHDPNSPHTLGADGEMINMASVGKPKKGGIHNALKSVAPSVPRARVLTPTPERKEMFGRLSKTDQSLLTKNGGRMTDKQKVRLLEKIRMVH